MKAKRLIEVAMPIKEISAESQRDKSIRHGHISTLHLWWARRPLPACRAVIFGSLVPDPLDENCPKAFKDAIDALLMKDSRYKPYADIPYTASLDPMEDNRRNRLIMFIGKFTDKCQNNMRIGATTPAGDVISAASLIKCENKDNEEVLSRAQKLIWVAYHSERKESSYKQLSDAFDAKKEAIKLAEDELYGMVDRHLDNVSTSTLEHNLQAAIDSFQNDMPAVFDPFSGGGAIPLEAARLGCRSYGNDINPVAHIIEKGSAELPQKFGKPIRLSKKEFKRIYGELGLVLFKERFGELFGSDIIDIPNRLSFDVEYYAKILLEQTEKQVGNLYPKDVYGNTAIAYYWARTARCSNPSCGARVPLLRGFYLADTKNRSIYLKPSVHGNEISFEVVKGKYDKKQLGEWNHHGTLTCPCCGNITPIEVVKQESKTTGLTPRLLAIIADSSAGKVYSIPNKEAYSIINREVPVTFRPEDKMQVKNNRNFNTPGWGIDSYGQIFSDRQLYFLNTLIEEFNILKAKLPENEYYKALFVYLAIWIDRIIVANTTMGTYHTGRENVEHIFGRQAIPMVFDFPESNPFCGKSGSAMNQIDWIIRYLDSESFSPFSSHFSNASSGDKLQFGKKSLTAVVTDPPYYDAIAYADCSDFFYLWLKRTLGDIYPLNFSTPQTPKSEECTALKHHHKDSEDVAKKHFEDKLTQIFDAIEMQTSDIVSIMFAHQSTEAWTTLCNSILGARMNITGSWPMDTEMTGALKTDKGYLESSVTVACRPSERRGFADFKEVKKAIFDKVEKEVNALYELGFRGADLLTACFGQAVSEFGTYKIVEKADGSEVSVAELLDIARTSAFNALLKGVQGDEYTRFYIGWLQMNGMGDTDFDDATKFTRVGMQVDVAEIFSQKLLIRTGSKQHLATAAEHIGNSSNQGSHPEDPLIDQVHRAMLAYEKGDRHILLTLLHNVGADDPNAPFWRLVASLKELLPDGKDLKAIEGLMGNSDNLRQESREVDQHQPEQMTLDFGGDFNNDFK